MALTALDDDELLDDDEIKKRPPQPQQPPQPIGKPMMVGPQLPPGSVPVGGGQMAPASIGKPIIPAAASTSTGSAQPVAPEMPAPTPPETPLGLNNNASMVAAPRPAGARLEALAAQGPPQLHGVKRFLDTLAGTTKIGTAIEAASGMGTEGYKAKMDQAEKDAQAEQGQIKGGEEERKSNADVAEEQARTGALESGGQLVPVTVNGVTYNVPQKDAERLLGTGIQAQSREDVANINATAKQKLQEGRPITMDELAAQATKENDQATLAKIEDYKKQIAAAGKQEPGSFMAVTDAAGNTVGWANPKSRDWVPASSIAGGAVTAAAGGESPTGGGAIPAKPSAIEKRMSDMAGYSSELIDTATDMIQRAKQELGPVAGRWNQFVAGQVGLKDVDWTGINAQLTFVTGALTLAHSQGRVSSLIMEQFQRLLDAGKQDPDNLLEALRVAKQAMGQVQGTFGGKAPGGPATPNAPPASGASPKKWNARTGRYD